MESNDGNKPLAFIKNDAGGVQQGYWEDVFPTIRTEITPAVAQRECFSITPCDANGTRKDRPDGGLYVLELNNIPGLTPVSLVPDAARAVGWTFPDLCLRILSQARNFSAEA